MVTDEWKNPVDPVEKAHRVDAQRMVFKSAVGCSLALLTIVGFGLPQFGIHPTIGVNLCVAVLGIVGGILIAAKA